LTGLTPEELFHHTFKKSEDWKAGKTDDILAAEESGTAWAKHFFPNLFSRPFTAYQEEFWDWGWGIEPEQVYRPRVECEPRGVGKSTNAEAWVVSMVARQKRKMIGYVSLNETKATKHFESIKSMLESDALLTAYPHCKPRIQKLRDTSQQWSREAIVMDSGAMIVPLTLLGSSRGWKSSEGSRFDVIVLDDIDELGQTPEYTKKLIEMLKGEILAAGYDKTVVLMPQNLIYRDSICSQIHDQRADILSNRIFCGPYPLLKWYDAEKVDIPGDTTGAKEWVITAGEAFDPAIDLTYATSLLNTYGKSMFDRECQQLVTQIEDDKDFREWSEIYHLVTYSEFRSVMESLGEPVWNDRRKRLQVPQRWNVGLGFDWGCLTLDTEILTKRGWKQHWELEDGELVAAFDWENTQTTVWSPLLKKIYKSNQPLVEMSRKSFKFTCTPDHAWIIRRKKRGKMTRSTYRRQNLDTIAKDNTRFVVAAPCHEIGEINCTPGMAAVLGWLVTDGWKYKKGGAMLCQKNFPEAVVADLNTSGLEWNEVKPNKGGVRLFYLPSRSYERLCEATGYEGKQYLPELVTKLSPEARQAMFRAMLEAEGTKNGTNRHAIFCQKRGAIMDAFQILATLCGHRLGVERTHESGFGESNRLPLLRHQHIQFPDIKPLEGLHDVWCPSVKEGAVIARYKGQVTITGNTTKGHPSAVAIVARPSEVCPLKNSHFVVSEVIKPDFPIDSHETPELVSPGRVATAIQDELREWNIEESQIQMRLMSHEASAAMNTMAIDLKPDIQQFFGKWKAQKGSGVPQIQNLLEIDHTKPHPFRKYPEGYTKDGINLGGQPLMGAPRLYFLVEDDQGELRTDLLNNLYVSGPKDADGFARARFEMPIYSHRNTSDAKKIDDDFVDAFRGLMNVFGVESTSKTYGEVAQEKYEATTVYARPEHKDDHSIGAQMSRAMAVSKVLKQMKDEGYDLDEDESGFSGIDLNGGY
jgi:hypothetical protein